MADRSDAPCLVWFRDDLRLSDHPALHAAAATKRPVICLYVFDETSRQTGARPIGGAARWWLAQSLRALEKRLGAASVPLLLRKGSAARIIPELARESGIRDVFWNQIAQAPHQAIEGEIASALRDLSVNARAFADDLLAAPDTVRTKEGRGLRVFTPFWRRDRPDRNGTSGLSPHLRFGEVSPRQVWHATQFAAAERPALSGDADKYLSELGWREFCRHLLFDVPDLATRNLQPSFDAFPWRQDEAALAAWQRGQTGYPIVDAGMRQLWHTGVMHNRVRMVVASFLVKHLLIDWREGEQWFWDTLVDADAGSNPANWQWVAGSGADAAPYFRIFNPVLQGEKFDSEGSYVSRWVPEVARLPKNLIHQPWEAAPLELASAGITLGKTYPHPIVDHRKARERALKAYEKTRGS